MTERYLAKSMPNCLWYGVLDCQLDEWHKEKVKTNRGLELTTLRFTHKEAAEYKADKLNEASK